MLAFDGRTFDQPVVWEDPSSDRIHTKCYGTSTHAHGTDSSAAKANKWKEVLDESLSMSIDTTVVSFPDSATEVRLTAALAD